MNGGSSEDNVPVQLWHSNQAVWYMIEEYQSMQRGQSGWPLSLNRVVDQLLIMCLTTRDKV